MANRRPASARELRERAEADLAHKRMSGAQDPAGLSKDDLRAVLHELQVQQVELELQNEELREAYYALDALHERYLDLYEQAPVGYCCVSADAAGAIVEANRTLGSMLGVERDTLINRPLVGLMVREDAVRFQLLRDDLIETAAPANCEVRLLKGDGSPLWVMLTATRFAAIGDEPRLRVTITDVSAHKVAAEALRASEAQSRAITESAHDAIVVASADGVIVAWNHGAQSMFGYLSDEAIGAPLTLLLPERYRTLHTNDISAAGKLRELQGLRKDGQEFAIEISLAEWYRGNERFVSAFIRDVSERIQARQALAAHYATVSRFNEIAVDRELRMVQLKSEINALCARLGEPPRHSIGTLAPQRVGD